MKAIGRFLSHSPIFRPSTCPPLFGADLRENQILSLPLPIYSAPSLLCNLSISLRKWDGCGRRM